MGRRGWARWRGALTARAAPPQIENLSPAKRKCILDRLSSECARSPVLRALDVTLYTRRGRFYLDRRIAGPPEISFTIGRITPLAGTRTTLLLEKEYGDWKEIARGDAAKVMKVVTGDRLGRFHGLGALDAALRARGLERQQLRELPRGKFFYHDGAEARPQETLYHVFGLPIPIIAQPERWYRRHRSPSIVEHDAERGRVLVDFLAASWQGESFGGRCLYARREDGWGAFTLRPQAGGSIAAAEAWLTKRHWEPWSWG